METGISVDLKLMRASVLLESDPAAAASSASAILKGHPDHEEARLLLATACRRMGDPATAQLQLEALIKLQPDSPALLLELGRVHATAGGSAQAIAALERAVTLDARLADGWRELATQRFQISDTAGGDAAYGRYLSLATLPFELKDAAVAIAEKRLDVADRLLQQRLQLQGDDVVALRMCASVASTRGDFLKAEQYLTRCLQIAPGYADARFDLASELRAQQRHKELLPHAERLLATEPGNTNYMSLKAQALRLYGRVPEAIAVMQKAISDNPGDAGLLLLYGHLLRESGEQAGAVDAYRRALTIQPAMGEGYWSLADLKTVRFTDADLTSMQQQLARSAPTGSSRVHLEFALGKALEDAGRFAESFEHYAQGNVLHRATIYFDAEVIRGGVQRSRALYSNEFFRQRSGWGSVRSDPIFVVGMPRSGSTLLEQILASHSMVEGTRELPDMPIIAREVVFGKNPESEPDYPNPVATLGKADCEAFANRYLQQTAGFRPLGKPRFVDKMLGNFGHIGLIHLMFPRATIIDARRSPLANCFSCFKQLFARGLTFTYDLQELGQYYRDYCELMDHMDTVLPGRVHRVHYEQLVADPEKVIRQLLNHCGLPFEAGCLRFYENRRVVNTVSSEQVRRPINSDAVDQWRNFEPWLGELKEALGDLVERYPRFS